MTARSTLPRLALLALPLAVGLAWSPAPAGSRIAGSFTATVAAEHAIPVPDAPMHSLNLVASRGTNRSTGATAYMDGGSVSNAETSDLAQGNGPHQGYITFTSGTDTTISHWSGKVTTVLGADKQPVTTFEGTWTMASGTGRFRGATGGGTYKGRMLSAKESAVDYTGALSGIKVAAGARP